ncbi:TetR/AcrR family transcriptional regulator [Streptomyces somaliensis]|uniref:TetR/AcrR family transcriptional regulator n=1 Tax=Streptomyces somaliensis (strain ATCC 33201 / DSM 40738 / JCM 12659 / KCTC 9044 / NCTC 11332 / NRRL B-12077 / IP 733) TaxID=1134445 RepID=A0AA44IF55_STRE0|nr:TetR/AcrR family transcriptional regulator [Streptomyces somaliensis]NKY16282.1 TetR/AcrR family transcriptional regulator [Streptomyces somaliensis DSM 40738]
MASRRDWLEEGLAVLGEEGAPALTVDRLAARLKLTKGSFYHHFKGMAGYKADLLAHYEAEHTGRYVADAERRGGGTPHARLLYLRELVLRDKDGSDALEIAVRAWALQDPEVCALQQRVDRARIGYLRELVRGDDGDADATPLARLLYLLLVGAQQLVPPLPAGELREVYDLVLRLTPAGKGPAA